MCLGALYLVYLLHPLVAKNIILASSHVLNYCVKFFLTNFFYMCMWQRHSRCSTPQAAWKSTKQIAASEATMNIKYRLRFWPRPMFMTDFSASLFARAIACVG